MELKKSPKADLESKKGIFLLIGLIIALSGTIIAMEWKSYDRQELVDLGELDLEDFDEENLIVDREEEEKPKEEKQEEEPPEEPEEIEIKEDEEELNNELKTTDSEFTDENLLDFEDEGDEDDKVYVDLSVMPLFKGSKKSSCDKKNYVKRNYFSKRDQKNFKTVNGEEMTYQDACNACTEMEIRKFIIRNVKYPAISKANGVEGKVIVKFVILKNGNVGQIKILRGLDKHIDAAVIKAVKKLPRFNPGQQNLKAVNVGYTIPVRMSLN